MDSPTGDAPRQSLLGSINFLARSARPRQPTNNNNNHNNNNLSDSAPALSSLVSSPSHRRRTAAAAASSSPSITQTNNVSNSGLGYMLRRRRSATALPDTQSQRNAPAADSGNGAASQTQTTHRIRLVPHLESHRSLHFEAITRDVRQGDAPLRIGRFTDRSGHSGNNTNKLAFKSKVVSRGHAEIWFDSGTFFIKDTKSSSGTFLNHIRLSSPNTESRPHPVKDGDILQLGVDYQGGTEEIYRCVKMRIELGREWQSGVNAFNSNALLQLKTLSNVLQSKQDGSSSGPAEKRAKSNLTDCCICLFQVTVCQSLFIAPCSHVYHYKCIRPLLEMHHPGFSCPLCRTFADLEADVELDIPVEAPAPAVEDTEMDIVLEEDAENMSFSQEQPLLSSRVDPPPQSRVDPPPQPEPQLLIDTAVVMPPAETSSETTPRPSPSRAIPRRRSTEGAFLGTDATPLNSTFLATLVRNPGSSGEGSSVVAPAVSAEDERGSASDDEEGVGAGGKRKR